MTRCSSIRHVIMIVLAVTTLIGGTYAPSQSKATVRVPFEFTANHQNLPSGYYTVELLSDRFLCFTDKDTGKHQAVIMVQPAPVQYVETRGALIFTLEGYRHYLSDVRFAGSSIHSAPVIRPSLARELAKNPRGARPIEVAMR